MTAQGLADRTAPRKESNENTDNETPVMISHDGSSAEQSDDSESESAPSKKAEEPERPKSMKCEIKHLDKKYDDSGKKVYIERKRPEDDGKQVDWWNLYALCETRHYYEDGDFKCTRLHVNPQPLKQLLEDIIGDFPGEPIDASMEVEIDLPAYCLFFYRKDIEEKGREQFKDDPVSMQHLTLLLKWIDETLEEEFKAHRRFFSGDQRAISYEYLWTIFKPDTLVYTRFLGQHRLFKLTQCYYVDGDEAHLNLNCSFIDYDGEKFGTRTTNFRIPKYSGTYRCMNLNAMPLQYHDKSQLLTEYLTSRGRRFESFAGQNFVQYEGVAVKRKDCNYERFNVNGRIMIDCKTYHRLDANDSFTVDQISRTESAKREREMRRYNNGTADPYEAGSSDAEPLDVLTDEDCMLTNATVRGYSFTLKRFLEFFVDKVSPIEWNRACFDQLVLDAKPKRTVQALVSTHADRRRSEGAFDDIVKGKGQGLVLVLHGPPGVGKTLTAECVAEWVQRPLYVVSSGDLGTNSGTLDAQLTHIMDMTSTWNAVLLIDEADVFLERRAVHDLHRNAMVSVFLRVLEYYQGILFLTTNRVTTFDDAFKSRIHVPLRYSNLAPESRRKIWKNFCGKVPGGADVDEAALDRLAAHNLNGRQIKNIVKTAESLARFEKKRLDATQIEQVAEIQAQFERDFDDAVDRGEEFAT